MSNARKVGKLFGCSKGTVWYWRKKRCKQSLLLCTKGGARNWKYSPQARKYLEEVTWTYARRRPTSRLIDYVCNAQRHGFVDTNRMFFSRLFKSWRWSFKRPQAKQTHKYSIPNIIHYVEFLLFARTVPWEKLKFLDEAHFISKGTYLPYSFPPSYPLFTVLLT